MPLKITNELLDDFQRMSDDDVKNVYGQLDDGERVELFDAISARKQGYLVGTKPAPVEEPVFQPNRSVGQPAETSLAERPNPYLKNPQQNILKEADFSKAPGKRELSNAVVEYGQENYGLPVAKKIIDTAPTVSSPAAKVLGRDALTRIAGPKVQDYGIDPAVKKQGEQNLVDTLGETGASIARGAVTEVFNPPNWIPLGWEEKAAEWAGKGLVNAPKFLGLILKPAAKMVANAAENVAIEGVVGTATNDQNMKDRLVGAGVAGAGMSLLGQAAKPVAKAGAAKLKWAGSKVLEMFNPKEIDAVIDSLVPDGVTIKTPEQAGVDVKELTPVAAKQVIGPDGTPTGRVVFEGGITQDIPLRSETDAIKFRKGMQEKGIYQGDFVFSRDELIAAGVPGTPGAPSSSHLVGENLPKILEYVDELPTSTPIKSWDDYLNRYVDKRPYVGGGHFGGPGNANPTVAKGKGRSDATIQLKPLTDQRPAPGNTGVLVIQKGDGSVKMENLTPTVKGNFEGKFNIGDHVAAKVGTENVIGRAGQTLDDGSIEVIDMKGQKHVLPNHSVFQATEDQILDAANIVGGSAKTPEEALLNAVQRNGRSSLKELAAHAGMDLNTTRDILGRLEDSGKVVNDDGDFSIGKGGKAVKPVSAPVPPPVPGKLYYQEGRNGLGAAEVVELSPDGKYAYVKYDRASLGVDKVPVSSLRPINPPGVADLRNVIPEGPKVDPTPPELIPKHVAMDIQLVHDIGKRFERRENAFVAFLKSLENQRHRGAKELQRYVKELQASEQQVKAKHDVHEAINAAVPKGPQRQAFMRDVHNAALGKMSTEDLGQKYPEIWNTARQVVQDTIEESKRNSALIAELGGLDEDAITMRAEGLIDQYVARKFRSYLDPKSWAKNIPAVVEQRMIKYLLDENPNANWTEMLLARDLAEIRKSADPIKAFSSSTIGKKYASALKTRKDIPAPVREYLGEITNGSISLAETIGNQRAIIQNLRTWKDIMSNPEYFSPDARTGADGQPFVRLPEDKKRFGAAAGGFVHPDIWEGMVPVEGARNFISRFMQNTTGWMKGNEVSTFKALYNSTFGNLTSTAFMGRAGLNLRNGAGDLRDAYKLMKAYRANPSGQKANLFQEAVTYGAHWGGQMENELGFKKSLDELDKVYGKDAKGSTVYELMEGLKKVATSPYVASRKFQGLFGSMLDANDSVFRFANYLSARRYYLSKGMSIEEAARAAAKDINDVFWNAQNVGKSVEKIRSSGAGFFARYATAKAEDLRIWKNAAQRVAQNNDARWRILGWSAAVAGAKVASSMKFGDDDQISNGENFTKRQQSWSPFMMRLPFTEDGKSVYYDMTPHFPMAQFMQGHPDDAPWRRILANLVSLPVEGGTGEGPITDAMNATGLTRPLMEGRGPIEGDYMNPIKLAWKLGFIPKLPGNLINEQAKASPTGIYPPQQGRGTAIARTVMPLVTEPDTALPKTKEFQKELLKLQSDLRRAPLEGKTHLIPEIVKRIQFISQQLNGGSQ